MKKIKTVTVVAEEQYGSDWPPNKPYEFMSWFQSKISLIPEEFRDSATIEIDSSTSYDSSHATIEIRFYRPETDAEEAAREQNERLRAEIQRNAELRTLSALKAKYGDT